MGFFDFLKKEAQPQTRKRPFVEPPDQLDESGELPFGWVTRHKDFTKRIEREYSYFLQSWLDSRDKHPKDLYSTLKSFVLYLENAEKLCEKSGECFEVWFHDLVASKEYITARKQELDYLAANFDSIQKTYERRQNLKSDVVILLKENDGILQSDFKKLFDPPFQNAVSEILYDMEKEGTLQKVKSGRSYFLHYKEA